ncbi:Nif3-like dinuclear metal center hexameric protein [Aliamphritea spongicola]|uniref:Nif3-like dinuclear metal center hexameric protein n=1 Tax=Aliamphritea spongicola TaxID=707589 RepID=UPI00196A2F23|nr:Nif3-like dinuclear metal center hexameric protein [Aliamphritea spongicola]MBN3562953.1 Nif3-like dinuclear metal center hexameric protein [Aliamphritea spongicola]
MAVKLNEIVNYTNNLLSPERYRDYCPNGLQVEGKPEVRCIVSGVTASQALLDKAVALNADLILVHHGYFWKGENPVIKGLRKRRLQTLLCHDISLLAYHLPLDGHPELGNNAQLAKQLGLITEGGLEADNPLSIGSVGRLAAPLKATEFAAQVADILGRDVLHVDAGPDMISTIAWCTGGAQGYIDKAIEHGVDAYLSGEISEPTTHSAREEGIHYFAAGHHATERYGAKALGEHLAEVFGVEHHFVDIDNPA